MESITHFIEHRLFLKVNKLKTQVVYFNRIKFLGYSFYRVKEEIRFRIHPKSVNKLRDKTRFLTSRSNGWGNAKRKERLCSFIKGWVNYFKYADIKNLLSRIDAWYRRRLRMVIWKQWKRVKTRYRNLCKPGIPKGKSWEWANTRKGYWHVSSHKLIVSLIFTAAFVGFIGIGAIVE